MLPTQFPVARYRFDFLVRESIRQPDYAGSMLRGAFGRALRSSACMTRQRECPPCPLYRSCPYPALFESPPPAETHIQKFSQLPQPYVIEPPTWGGKTYHPGEHFSFHMVLIGDALRQLPLIVHAWQQAFTRNVGHGQALLDLVSLQTANGTQPVWDGSRLQSHDSVLHLIRPTHSQSFSLQFHTPLRLQENGKALPPTRLDASRLLISLAKRCSLLAEFCMRHPLELDFTALKAESQSIKDQRELQWQDWTRYSSRQQQTMQLGGVVGQWVLYDLPEHWQTLLMLGQWLHIGKNASFGLGQYQLQLA